jgi:type I restriction enzyme S subunit
VKQATTDLGSHINTRKGYAFKSKWYTDEGRPIVKVSDFTEDSIDTTALVHIPEDIAQSYLKYELKTGDVIVQTVGSWPSNPQSVVGKAIRVPSSASGALLNQNAVKITPDESLENSFLFFLLKSPLFKGYIINTAQGAASQASITLDSIKGFQFDLPPLPTQRKIAAVLSAYDDLIENNTRRIAILEEMAQALYREWFVHFRFPGHEDVNMVESELGPVPEGWEVVKLRDTCEYVNYGYTAQARSEQIGPKFLRITDIVPPLIDWETVPHCEIDEGRIGKYLLEEGDIVIARTGATVGYAKRIGKRHPKSVFASYLVRLRVKREFSNLMIGLLVESDEFKRFVDAHRSGAAQPQANAQVLTSFILLLPPKGLQGQFDEKVKGMFEQKEILRQKNSTLRRTRDLLLPRLISGEVDVAGLEIAVEG